MKKLTTLLLAVVILASIMLSSCQINQCQYILNDDKASYSVSVWGYSLAFLYDLNIEEYHNGLPVTKIASGGFTGNNAIGTVSLGSLIEEIGTYGFGSCESLTYFYAHEGLKVIGDYAFVNCENLTGVFLPSTVEYIGLNAFGLCVNLEYIEYNGTMAQWHAIEKAEGWNYQTGLNLEFYQIICLDGVIYMPDGAGTLPDISN